MPTATVTSRTTTTEVTLAISGRTIDVGEYNDYAVTQLQLTYRGSEITAIRYDTIEDGSPSSAAIHPRFLAEPDAWPDWVRDLVNEHRPA